MRRNRRISIETKMGPFYRKLNQIWKILKELVSKISEPTMKGAFQSVIAASFEKEKPYLFHLFLRVLSKLITLQNLRAQIDAEGTLSRISSWQLCICYRENLDRSDATFRSVDRFELLSLNSFIEWISVSNSVAGGVTIAFILLSTSFEDVLLSSSWDFKLFSPSLADLPELRASPISKKCLAGILFPSDIVNFEMTKRKYV